MSSLNNKTLSVLNSKTLFWLKNSIALARKNKQCMISWSQVTHRLCSKARHRSCLGTSHCCWTNVYRDKTLPLFRQRTWFNNRSLVLFEKRHIVIAPTKQHAVNHWWVIILGHVSVTWAIDYHVVSIQMIEGLMNDACRVPLYKLMMKSWSVEFRVTTQIAFVIIAVLSAVLVHCSCV